MNEASKLASDAGNATAQNVVLLGALASTGKLPIRKISLTEVLAELFAAKHAKTNVEAFKLGYQYMKSLAKTGG